MLNALENKTYNIGLIGAGRIGTVHAGAIQSHPNSRVVAVSDFNMDTAQALADTCQAMACSTNEIIANDAIDAVLIASPTDTHADLIEAATAQGKAVLCEKPVDLNLARARQCLEAVQERAQPIMIGFNRRFDSNFQRLKAALDAGDIGNPELITITSYDPAPPPIDYVKVSGGLFRDMMIHDFDMIHFLMGEPPVEVFVTASNLVDKAIGEAGDVDTAVACLRFADGRIAVIKNSRRAAYGYDQRIEVLGAKGLLEAQNKVADTVAISTENGVHTAPPLDFFMDRYADAYRQEWGAFVAALANKTHCPVTLGDGVAALALAEAATLSFKKSTPVRLSDV